MTGGYFADPGVKDVPGLAHLGFPFCDVDADGNGVLGKVAGTGGLVTLRPTDGAPSPSRHRAVRSVN